MGHSGGVGGPDQTLLLLARWEMSVDPSGIRNAPRVAAHNRSGDSAVQVMQREVVADRNGAIRCRKKNPPA
jgi:hypothetical protein